MVHHLSYAEAVIVGAFQGITELFPVSSLGHSVLLPALIGGQWARDLNVSTPESPYLAFIVGLHVATAAALLVFFWRDWIAVIAGIATATALTFFVTISSIATSTSASKGTVIKAVVMTSRTRTINSSFSDVKRLLA